MNGNTWFSKVG